MAIDLDMHYVEQLCFPVENEKVIVSMVGKCAVAASTRTRLPATRRLI